MVFVKKYAVWPSILPWPADDVFFQVAWSKDLSSFEGKTFTICVSFANWVRIENGGFSEISMGF